MKKRFLWNNENCNYGISIIPKGENIAGDIIYLNRNQISRLKKHKITNPYDNDLRCYIEIIPVLNMIEESEDDCN